MLLMLANGCGMGRSRPAGRIWPITRVTNWPFLHFVFQFAAFYYPFNFEGSAGRLFGQIWSSVGSVCFDNVPYSEGKTCFPLTL